MTKFFFTLVLVFTIQLSFAQDVASRQDIMKIIELSGADASLKVAKDQILKMIPAEKQPAFLIEFDATLPPIYDKIVKIYQEAYSKEDVAAMLVFYNSPVGKKITMKAPEIAQKAQDAGQEWGQGLQAMLMKYLQ